MPTIRSNADPRDPHPWYRLTATTKAQGGVAVEVHEANGVRAFSQREVAAGRRPPSAVSAEKETAQRRRHGLAVSPAARVAGEEPTDPARPQLADEVHVVAVTLDGDVVFVPMSRQAAVYYAHLAWYDPLTDTWSVLDFADEAVTTTV